MVFRIFIPRPQLLRYIENIWVQEDFNTVNYGTINPIKVLPSTNMVMGFQYGERQEVSRNGETKILTRHGFSGLQTGFSLYKNSGSTGSVIVRFKPWAASHFFKIPLIEFKDQNIDSELVFDKQLVSNVIHQLCESVTIEQRVEVVESYLVSLLVDKPMDKLIKSVTEEIHKTNGLLKIDDIARNANISKRQLERKFNEIIGVSPKKFSTIVRFQQAIQSFEKNDTLTALAYDSGYFDQAHFIREFQNFASLTPEQFFMKKLQPELSEVFNAKLKLSLFQNSLYQ